MTAINLIVGDNDVTIFTDTRARTAGGPDFNAPKVFPIPHMRLAVAIRGRMERISKVVGVLCISAFDFDSARAFFDAHYADLDFDDLEIVVGGWSDEGPAAFIVSATNTGSRVLDLPQVLVTPVVQQAAFDEFAADPTAGIPKLMQLQASVPSNGVGGYVSVCQVTETAIAQWIA